MAASIRIEDEAFSDARINLLAEIAGYTNAYEALGRMAHLWRLCTQRQQHIVSEAMVRACLGPAGVQAAADAELVERLEDGMYRIKGTTGRIEWLGKARESSAAGGRARAAASSRTGGKFTSATSRPAGETPAADQPEPAEDQPHSSVPAPAPAPAPTEETESAPRKSRKPRRVSADVPIPEDWTPTPAHVERASSLGIDLDWQAARFRLDAEAKGKSFANWNSAFSTWLMRSSEFAAKDRAASGISETPRFIPEGGCS